jgi:hypothetical protein
VAIAYNGNGSAFTNTGTISATGANATIDLANNSNTWDNSGGTITLANGATLNLGGSFGNANLGTINGANGTINLTGTLTNTGTLAGPTTGVFNLHGGTISGGTVDGALNILQFTNSGGTLNNVAMINNFTVAQNAGFTMAGTTSFNGNVTLGGSNSIYLASPTSLTIGSTAAWTDSGSLNFYGQTAGVTIANQGSISTNGGWFSGQGNGNFLINNSGTVTNSGGSSLQLGYYNGDALTNSGTILNTTSTNASPSLSLGGSNNTVTNSGLIESQATGSGSSQVYVANGSNSTLANTGTLEATGANAYLTVSANNGGNTWTNTGGTIEALNGATVNLAGSFTTATLTAGHILGVGGTLNLTGALNNTGATLAAPTSGIYTLDGGSISGGTVDGSLGALQFNNNNGTLNNVSMVNNFTIGQNTTFTVAGTTSFSGNVTWGGSNNIDLDTTTPFTIGTTSVWTDSGNLNFYAQTSGASIVNQGSITTNGGWMSGQGYGNFLINNSGTITNSGGSNLQLGYYNGDSLTNSGTILNTTSTNQSPTLNIGGSNNTVTNSGLIESQATGSGNSQVYVSSGTSSTLHNTGTLEATGANAYLTVGANNTANSWTNTGGTIEALNGATVYLAGGFTTATLEGGQILGGGGTLNLTGMLNNNGATLAAPTSGIYTLDGGTITGGTVDASLGALQFSNNNGTLNNVAMVNNFTIGQSTTFTVAGTTSFSGSVTLGGSNNINLNTTAPFTIASTATWTDSGGLNFYGQTSGVSIVNQGSISTNGGWFSGQGYGNFLINNSGTITNSGGNSLQLGYYNGDSLTNSGTILNTTSTNQSPTMNIGGSNNTVTNSGLIESQATGSGNSQVYVSSGTNSTLTNTGTLEATGANAYLTVGANNSGNAWTNTGGTIEALNGATVNLAGSFTTATLAGGRILGAGGTLNLTGALNNTGATLAAPTSGIYTLDGGSISGGTVNGSLGALQFSNNNGTLNNVSMVNNFTIGQTTTFTVAGTTSFSGNVTLGGGNNINLSTTTPFTIAGTATWTDSGALNFYAQTAGATIANEGSITTNGGWMSGQGYGNFLINNSGAITNSGSSSLQLGYYNGDSLTNSGTITNQGSGNAAPSVSIGGSNNTITNSGTMQTIMNGTNTATLTVGNGSNTTITNTGTGSMLATNSGSAGAANLVIASGGGVSFTNQGTVGANGAGATAYVDSTTNLSGGTLTGGTWSASNGGTLQFSGGPITTNAATLDIDGTGSVIKTNGGSQTLQQTLTTNNGTLSLDPVTFANSNALTNNGAIDLAGATLSAPSLTNTATGTITGNGAVNSPVTNQGSVTASGGTLTMSSGIVGATGTVQVNSAATLSLAGGSTASTAGTLTDNGSLALGTNNITVSNSYTNANFGTGNSFNARAGVTGTGQILAAGNTAQTITGSAVANGSSGTPTLTLANMRVGGTQTVTYGVENSGTSGPSFVGAIQTDVNGGNITDTRLSGSGVTAGNFGPLASGQSQGFSVTETGTTAGALAAGQTVEVVSNFANVGPQTLAVSGGSVYQPAEANTLSNVNVGNYHVGAAPTSDAVTITNVAPNTNGYTETLGAAVTGSTGPVSTSGSVTGLAQGQSSNGISVSLNTQSAGSVSGTTTIDFQTQAINNSGLGTLDLGSQTVTVSGTGYQLAQASLQPSSPIALGNSRIGGTLSEGLTVTNSAPNTNGYTETLSGNVGGNTGSATSAGSFSGVQQGAANSTGINVSLSTAAAGQISGSTTVAFDSNAINNSGLGTTQLQSQTVNLTGTVYQSAVGSVTNSSPINLGNFHVGDTASTDLTISNVAPNTQGYTENLGASVSGTTGQATGSGSVTGLAQGASNSTGITVGLNTGTAGTLSGSATVGFQTQAINNSGLGTASVGSQTVDLTGTAYALAQASVQPASPISLGNARIGGTLSQDLTVTNSGANTGGFTETLSGNVGGNTGSATSTGSFAGVAQGAASNNGIAVSLSTATAGQVSGSTTLAFNSNAIDNSGLGTTQLAGQTVNLTGAVYQPAEANTLSNVNLGNFHVGASESQTAAIQNVASGPVNYTETLGANVGGTSGAATATGSVSGLGQGASGNGIAVGLNTQTAGNLSGTATVDFQTQAVNNSGLGVASLGSQTIQVTGTGYALAQASVQPASPISLGNARIGGTLSQNLTVTNSGANTGGFTETLSGNVGGNTGAATSAGSFAGVTQGTSNNSGIAVSLSTASAGQVSGSTTLAFNSNAINNSGLGTTQLASQTVNLTGAVYQAASGQVSNGPTVDLGNFHVGDTATGTLTIANVAPNTGGYTENLGATVTGTSGLASASGSVTGLAQGANNSTGITVGLNTSRDGILAGTATVGFQTQAINNSGLGTASVGSQTVTVQGAAYNLASASVGAIDFGRVLQNSAAAQYLTVSNTAVADGFSEGLDATIAGFTGVSAGLLSGGGSITNLAAGATSTNGLEVSLNTSNTGTVMAEVKVNLASDGTATSGLGITQLPQQSAAVSGEIYVEAQVGSLASASAAAPNPVNLGNVRVGAASPTQALTLSNTAVGPAEGLNASISTTSSGLTASGTFSSLQAGQTDNSSMVVGMNTATAGLKNGTATIALASDGSYNNGVTTSLGTQTIDVTGAVYQSAQANTLPTTVNLGNFHVGDTATGALNISNVAPNTNGYTENLGASVTGASGQATATGSISGLQQGASSNGITVGLNTGTAGALSGTATVDFQTQAINNSGLGTADVGSQTVDVQGAAYQLAQANAQPTQVNLGSARIGGTLSQNLNVSNVAPNTNGYTENLGGSASGNGSGSFTGLAQGQGTSALTVSLSTAQAGAVSGAANLSFESEAINNSGLGTTALAGQTVNLVGAVYQTAEASTLPSTVNLGTLRAGSSVTTALMVGNVAPDTQGYTETLGASFGSASSGLTASGAITGLAQGATSNELTVGFTAGQAGEYGGSAKVDFDSEAIDNSGLGDLDLGSQTVQFSATVNAVADAKVGESGGAFAFTQTGDDSGVLNFGDLTEGEGDVAASLFLENNVSGPADELLSLIDAAGLSGSPFAYLGSSDFDLSAQQQGGFSVDFDTDGETGRFEATLVFDDASHNDDQSDLSLAPYELTIEGDILPASQGGSGVPDSASSLLLLGAALGALVAGRRWICVTL